jgi:hypothetical protein
MSGCPNGQGCSHFQTAGSEEMHPVGRTYLCLKSILRASAIGDPIPRPWFLDGFHVPIQGAAGLNSQFFNPSCEPYRIARKRVTTKGVPVSRSTVTQIGSLFRDSQCLARPAKHGKELATSSASWPDSSIQSSTKTFHQHLWLRRQLV